MAATPRFEPAGSLKSEQMYQGQLLAGQVRLLRE
jgi:hypothetical protein